MILSFESLVACYVRRNSLPADGSAGPGGRCTAALAAAIATVDRITMSQCPYSRSKSTKSESSLCLLLAGLSSSSLLAAEVSLLLPPGLAEAPPLVLLALATDVLGALLAGTLEVLLLAGALGGSDACG